MTARVLRLPETPGGRELMRSAIVARGAWDFPDGSAADELDWDQIAADVARMLAAETHRAKAAPIRGRR